MGLRKRCPNGRFTPLGRTVEKLQGIAVKICPKDGKPTAGPLRPHHLEKAAKPFLEKGKERSSQMRRPAAAKLKVRFLPLRSGRGNRVDRGCWEEGVEDPNSRKAAMSAKGETGCDQDKDGGSEEPGPGGGTIPADSAEVVFGSTGSSCRKGRMNPRSAEALIEPSMIPFMYVLS